MSAARASAPARAPNPLPFIVTPWEARGLRAGQIVQLRRPMKPCPPELDHGGIKRQFSFARAVHSSIGLFSQNDYPSLSKDRFMWETVGDVGVVRDACGATRWKSPFGATGDTLRICEKFACSDDERSAIYAADHEEGEDAALARLSKRAKWRPACQMSAWFSRTFVAVTDVRVEHLSVLENNEEAARAEGIVCEPDMPASDPFQPHGLPGKMTNRTGWAARIRVWEADHGRVPGRLVGWTWVAQVQVTRSKPSGLFARVAKGSGGCG